MSEIISNYSNYEELFLSIERNGFFVSQDFFNSSFILELMSMFDKRKFLKSGIGKNGEVNSNIRGDFTSWVTEEDTENVIIQYQDFIKKLQSDLNKKFFLNTKDYIMHFAKYDNGGFYKKHLDNINGKNNRVLTFITYLNKNWQFNDGGELVLHHSKKIIIPPNLNTFVCFLSQEVPHEVLPSHNERKSITGWLLN